MSLVVHKLLRLNKVLSASPLTEVPILKYQISVKSSRKLKGVCLNCCSIHISPLRSKEDKFTLYQIKVLCCCTVWLLSCKQSKALRWERQREERKSNFLSLFKAHLKFGMKELILDSLLIPLDSQMKNVFEILKGSLEIHSKHNSMSCENIISGKHWQEGNFTRTMKWKTKQNSQPQWKTKWGNAQLTIPKLPVLPYYYSKSSKWPVICSSYNINKIWQHW